MIDPFNLNRFLLAQIQEEKSYGYDDALREIKLGKKQTHWMWYIFPQFIGLGTSYDSTRYAIKSREEALAYVNHPILGQRLIEISTVLLNIENLSAYSIFDSPDDVKLKSSMTLFNAVQNEKKVFELVLDKYYFSSKCEKTLRYLGELK
ncbi:MAG: DUF1810 domain-containing protein [Bacteroidetes bacterium]|nr:DUF1810 domain-containing protein [Bacteroidota bacterium]